MTKTCCSDVACDGALDRPRYYAGQLVTADTLSQSTGTVSTPRLTLVTRSAVKSGFGAVRSVAGRKAAPSGGAPNPRAPQRRGGGVDSINQAGLGTPLLAVEGVSVEAQPRGRGRPPHRAKPLDVCPLLIKPPRPRTALEAEISL